MYGCSYLLNPKQYTENSTRQLCTIVYLCRYKYMFEVIIGFSKQNASPAQIDVHTHSSETTGRDRQIQTDIQIDKNIITTCFPWLDKLVGGIVVMMTARVGCVCRQRFQIPTLSFRCSPFISNATQKCIATLSNQTHGMRLEMCNIASRQSYNYRMD